MVYIVHDWSTFVFLKSATLSRFFIDIDRIMNNVALSTYRAVVAEMILMALRDLLTSRLAVL